MKEVLPGIFQVPLTLSGFVPNTVNTYLVQDGSSYTMIDTGWDSPPAVESLEKQLAEIGAGLADIRRAIMTHCHLDHFGMFPRFKKNFHTQIYFNENDLELVKTRFIGGDNYLPMTDQFLQTHGVPLSELTPPEFQIPLTPGLATTSPDVLLHGGEEIVVGDYTFKVINTPGHTPGHMVLYEPNKRFLFSGDILLPTIATNAAMHVQQIQFPIQQYLNSLLTLKALEIETILPGHEYIFSHHRERIEELFKHHQKKVANVRRTFKDSKARTAYDTASDVFHRLTKPFWSQMTGWDKRFAVLQTIAHLESLRFDEILVRELQGDIFYYHLKD